MKIIKRNGSEATFDLVKIIAAVTKANNVVAEDARMTPMQIRRIAESVENSCLSMNRALSVEEIQDLVEDQIMAHGAFEVAKNYITYRYTRTLVRKSNTTDEKILSLIESNNEEVKQENSNKNPTVNAVQRDYMAGEVSKDLTARVLLPQDIVEAHNEGIIHFHDADYFAQHMHNCDLVNLEDMLQNGTVISGTLIEKPHSFSTACNIATQIIAQMGGNILQAVFDDGSLCATFSVRRLFGIHHAVAEIQRHRAECVQLFAAWKNIHKALPFLSNCITILSLQSRYRQ